MAAAPGAKRIVIGAPRHVDVLEGIEEASAMVPAVEVVAVTRRRRLWIRQRIVIRLRGGEDELAEFQRHLRDWSRYHQQPDDPGSLSSPW
jgi:hypothetical protein